MQRVTEPRQRIGPAIRRLRRERGLTLDALANAAHVSPSHLSRLERSQTLPSFPVLAQIADALDVDVNDLVSLERDVTKLDEELAWFLDVLAVGPMERAELFALSIEARRSLVSSFRALAHSMLTSPAIQEEIIRQLHANDGPEALSRLAPVVEELGMGPVAYARALMMLDQTPGRRLAVIGGQSLLPVAPGIDLIGPFRSVFGEQVLDPVVATWWTHTENDETAWSAKHRPTRVVVSASALQTESGALLAKRLLNGLQQHEPIDVAITERPISDVNLMVVEGQCGVIEHLPESVREQQSGAAVWIAGQDYVQELAETADRVWESLTMEETAPDLVVSRLTEVVSG